MSYGYAGQILKVDLKTGRVTTAATSVYAGKYLGGRGVAARVAWEEIPPRTDAFNPENRLIFMTGPLTGTLAPTSGGRVEVTGVGAQVYPEPRYTRSSMGGHWGAELKYAGYDGIILHGKASSPVYLWVRDGEAEVLDAAGLWGLDTYETQLELRKRHGKRTETVCIGPAGENLSRIAVIQSGLESAAGQGGFGAVMGSKNLKAVAVRGSGGVKVAKPEEFQAACSRAAALAGTPQGSRGRRDAVAKACTMSCTVETCGMRVHKQPGGRVAAVHCCSGYYLNLVPYEEGARAAELANRLGLNHWEIVHGFGGSVGGWLQKCKDAGILKEQDLGVPLRAPLDFDDGEFWCRLLPMMAYRQGIGDIFADGVPRAADRLAKGKAYLPHVAYGFETHWDGHIYGAPCYPYWLVSALTWATDSRDPMVHGYAQAVSRWWDRFRGPLTIEQIKKVAAKTYGFAETVDPESGYRFKAEPTIWHQNRDCVKDSLCVCDQVFPVMYSRETADGAGDTGLEAQLLSAVTGRETSEAELDRIGERIFNLERAIMAREGRTRKDDEEAASYFKQPDPQGIAMDEYYSLRGWDLEKGWPTRAKLNQLSLSDVADELAVY
ncbi:MAG: aldehyde ferredoxin oxidoreductase N-terminal domain-containing protein [Candidatus Bathyarchaeia archaeon]